MLWIRTNVSRETLMFFNIEKLQEWWEIDALILQIA